MILIDTILLRNNCYLQLLLTVCLYLTGTCFSFAPERISDNWAATDALGRKLPSHSEVGDFRKDKYVALFYWTWHGKRHADPGYANISRIVNEYPEAVNDYNHPTWKSVSQVQAHHWSEPLFGYYRTTDPWVLRKHGEMLADAGVDVVVFDCTNGTFTWKESYEVLCKVWTEAREDGILTPQISFLCPFGPSGNSKVIVEKLYNDIYKSKRFKDLWFYWDGKPLIMAYPDNIKEPAESFFTFRPGQPDYRSGPRKKIDWSWLEVFPQNGYVEYAPGKYEMVSVGVAQNATDKLSPAAMNGKNQVYGRSFTKTKGFDSSHDAVMYGLNFQEQWDRAMQLDPKLIFVTGWNEWVAGRFKTWQGTENAFPDQFNVEYSRDIEPTKEGIGDNYYYQLISNIRRFKGLKQPEKSSGSVSIQIDGAFSDWTAVKPVFKDHKGDTIHRNHRGYGELIYTNTTGRNDFVKSKVTYDKQNLYFFIETAEPIRNSDKQSWMMLMLDTDRNKKTGWQGYDYIINRTTECIERNLDNKWLWKKIGSVKLSYLGIKLELSIDKTLLSESIDAEFEFKWTDNIIQNGDVMDFYLSGDVAPSGRFNYIYQK